MAAKEDDYDPSKFSPKAAVMGHIGVKGFEAGSLLGVLLGVPLAAFRHKRAGGLINSAFLFKAESTLRNWAIGTSVLSLLAGYGVLGWKEGWDKEKLEDRAYRLHYNKSQNRTDFFSGCGALAGGIGGVVLGARGLNRIIAGMIVGTAAGTITHVVTSQSAAENQITSAKDSVQKVTEELKR